MERVVGKLVGKRLLSVEEAGAYLGLSPRTIYNGLGRKTKNPFPIPHKKWGKRVLFDVRDLDSYVDKMEHSE